MPPAAPASGGSGDGDAELRCGPLYLERGSYPPPSSHRQTKRRIRSKASHHEDAPEFAIEKVVHSGETVWFDRKKTHGLQGVSDDVWSFEIGGYQVCEKWLKDRIALRGRGPGSRATLSAEDLRKYRQIIAALDETTRVMTEIDRTIEDHGGWPGAFNATS